MNEDERIYCEQKRATLLAFRRAVSALYFGTAINVATIIVGAIALGFGVIIAAPSIVLSGGLLALGALAGYLYGDPSTNLKLEDCDRTIAPACAGFGRGWRGGRRRCLL